jgi:hypothetical protein
MLARLARSSGWLPALACIVFATLWLQFWDYWLDDAFIFFRYARNLAEGLGPVFNPGEAVEGYTSFLWLAVSALPFSLLPDPAALRAIEVAGGALGLLTLWRCFSFPGPGPGPFPGAKGAARRRPLALVLAACPVFVINSADGMETPLFGLLLLETARALVLAPTARSGALVGILTAACALTRPEALPLLVLLPALTAALRGGSARPWLAAFAATALPPILVHLAWRLSFYGALLPNTFQAKATGALLPRLASGAGDLGALLAQDASGSGSLPPLWLWLALALAVLGLRTLRNEPIAEARIWLAGLWGMVVFRVAFQLWSGSEYMGTFRFLAPALPPLFVLADEGLREIRGPRRRAALTAALAIGLLSGAWGTIELSRAREPYRRGLAEAHIALGRWLAQTQDPGTWIALGDVGAVPFFSRLPTIDLWGLADATIARLPGEYGAREGVADYALGRRPGLVILWNRVPIRTAGQQLQIVGGQPFDREIAGHAVFRAEYRFLREFTFRPGASGQPGYYLDVFAHRPAAAPRPGETNAADPES